MEAIQVANKIESLIQLIDKGRAELQPRATRKAEAIAHYEKEIAKTIIRLKNGVEMELDGEKIVSPPATIIEKIAKGICWKEKLDAEKSELEYRNAVVGMSALESQLNGYQSINRHLSEV